MNWRIGITRLIFVLGGLWASFALVAGGYDRWEDIAIAFGPLFGLMILAVLGDWVARGFRQ